MVLTSGLHGDAVRRQRAAAIEAEPAKPKQASAQQHDHKAVRLQGGLAFLDLAPAKDTRGRQRRHTRGHVHGEAAGKVACAQLMQPATTPDPMRNRAIDEGDPKHDEGAKGAKLNTLGHGARQQRRRDHGEHALEEHEQQFRDLLAGTRFHPDAVEGDVVQIADNAADAGTEGEGIAP